MLLLLPVSTASASGSRFAVIIGNNRGRDPSQQLRYAERDARKMHEVLTQLGGFAPEDTELLLDADAATAWKSIRRIEKKLAYRRKKSGARSLLLLYYSGHAEGEELELGSSSMKFGEIMRFLRSSAADVRLAFLDSCLSGKLITAKGGRRGPGFDIQVTDEIDSRGYAVVTSSAHDELSQESGEIRGAFFTHYLVSALRGAGDRSGDGKVTLNEAYQYAYARTLARTSATIGGSQHPMYEFQLRGKGEIVLTRPAGSGSRISIKSGERGRLVLLDDQADAMVGEAEVNAGQSALFAVRPGPYTAYLLTPDRRVRLARVRVASGEQLALGTGDFRDASLETAAAKGGLFREPERPWIHRLAAGGLWRHWPLWGADLCYGASAVYRLQSPQGWEPVAKLTWTTRPDVGLSTGYHDLGLMAGMGYVFPISRASLRAELLAGYEHLLQERTEIGARHTSGFDYLGLLGLEVPSDLLFGAVEVAAGGRVFQVIGKGWVHRFDLQAILMFGWKWEHRP